MSIKSKIIDGGGSSEEAEVTEDSALKVRTVQGSFSDLSRKENERFQVLYEQASLNSSADMAIDASGEPHIFSVESERTRAKSLQQIRFLVESSRMSLRKAAEPGRLGEAGVLENGIEFFVRQGGIQRPIFPSKIRRVSDFLFLADDFHNIESARANNIDLFIVTIDMPIDIRILPESKDRFEVVINDDLSDLTRFEALVIGFSELVVNSPEELDEELEETPT